MSTSLLYHGFGLPTGYEYQSSRYENGSIIFVILEKRFALRCSSCDSREIHLRGSHTRIFRALPIGNRPCYFEFAVPRVQCLKCKLVRQVKVRFTKGSEQHTKRFKKLALMLSRHMTIKAVAKYLRVSWDFVKDIQKDYLQRRYKRPNIKKLKRVAIDEVYMGKKAGYLTIVLDLQSGIVVYVGKGKSGESLDPFWERLRRAKVKLEVVATDMGAPFIKSARDNQPDAVNVADHFHVIKLFNEKLTILRRDMQRDAETAMGKKVLKGIRWLLMLKPENLALRKASARQRLDNALELNKPLATAYYMKEELRLIWQQKSKKDASNLLTEWVNKADVSGIRVVKSFARTLARLRVAILAYYDFKGLSSGKIEGSNNKIKTIHKVAYGYRDMEFLKLKILSMHENREDALSG
ncbi:MAG: ISL3 family transposase [Ghiorsea sp.]|nr:ISL3 family transposase [Ghiorsea sp.]